MIKPTITERHRVFFVSFLVCGFFFCVCLTDMTNHDRFFSTRARASATMVTKASTRDRWPNCHGGCFLFFCFHPVHSSFDQCSSFDLIMYIFFFWCALFTNMCRQHEVNQVVDVQGEDGGA